MVAAILQADVLNLPEIFAIKFHGKKVELIEDGDTVTIKPVECPIEAMHGMLKSDGHAVDRFLALKREEKELEYNKIRS